MFCFTQANIPLFTFLGFFSKISISHLSKTFSFLSLLCRATCIFLVAHLNSPTFSFLCLFLCRKFPRYALKDNIILFFFLALHCPPFHDFTHVLMAYLHYSFSTLSLHLIFVKHFAEVFECFHFHFFSLSFAHTTLQCTAF